MPGLARGSALSMAAVVAALFLPSAASADITGHVQTPRGAPVGNTSVEIRDSADKFADFVSTDASGNYRSKTSTLSGYAPPFTVKGETFDRCDTTGTSTRNTTVPGVGDGQVVDMQLDVLEFCNATTFGSGTAEGTALVDGPGHTIIGTPGGTGNINVLAPSSAKDVSIALPDGTVLGTNPTDTTVPITLPANPFQGTFKVTFTASDGTTVISYDAGTLIVAQVGPPAPATGNLDLEAIVDLSGSMSGTDPKYRRKDAVHLLADLATKGDKLGAVGFDDTYKPIFALTQITGAAVIKKLKTVADTAIVNGGGTNYNVGFDEAFKALTGPGVDPKRPKGAIFLTDGGHNSGPYNNGHLHFAINNTGHSWPVCVVQLGTNFQAEDVARLKRIAAETGGQYVSTPTDDQLAGLYFSCLGRTTGAQTLLNKIFKFKEGQTRKAKERLPKKKLPSVTFFVNWGDGTYELQLKDPTGKIHTRKRPGNGATFGQGNSYAFFRIRRPLGGLWQVIVKAVNLDAATDQANVKITVIPRKK